MDSTAPLSVSRGSVLTWYRIIFLISLLGFGIAKAVTVAQGQQIAPNMMDMVYGLVITLM